MTSYALVGAAEFNSEDFLCRQSAGAFDRIIAIDGGYAHVQRAGVVPDLVMGDFDSLGFVPDHAAVARFSPEKDASDLELACERACAKGATELWVYACLSGRLDHTIAALHLFAHYAERGVIVTGIGDSFAVRVVVGPAAFTIPHVKSSQPANGALSFPKESSPFSMPSGTVSVFSACACAKGITERGLKYPLENATLSNRTSRGLSNEMVGSAATISVEEGSVYVFYSLV